MTKEQVINNYIDYILDNLYYQKYETYLNYWEGGSIFVSSEVSGLRNSLYATHEMVSHIQFGFLIDCSRWEISDMIDTRIKIKNYLKPPPQ